MRCHSCDTVWIVDGADAADDDDAPTGVPRAAVVRRGDEREKRDLFAPRGEDHGAVSPTMPPPSFAPVAARHESSVLFTVDSLRGSARVKTPAPEPRPLSLVTPAPAAAPIIADDEGIIDLNALASTPTKAAPRHVAPPFASDPPPAAFSRDASDSYPATEERRFPAKLKRAGIVAGAAAAVVVLVLGLASAFKGEEPVARTAAPPPPPPVAATPAPAPAPTTDPAPASTSTDDAKGGSASTSGKKGKRGGFAKAAPATFKRGVTASDPAPAAAPKPVKAADPCGCHGDFTCILRCTATGK